MKVRRISLCMADSRQKEVNVLEDGLLAKATSLGWQTLPLSEADFSLSISGSHLEASLLQFPVLSKGGGW